MKNYSFLVWLHYSYQRQPAVLRQLDALKESQWWTEDVIRAYQREQLREIVAYAGNSTAYYKRLFETIGLRDIRDFRGPEDLAAIPPISKQEMRAHLDELTAQRSDCEEYQTGGSTGVPLTFYGNAEFLHVDKPAANFRAYSHGGYRPGDGMGIIWGYDKDIPVPGLKGRFVRDNVYRYCELNSFRLTPETMRRFIQDVQRKRPPCFRGYATSLMELSRFMLEEHISPGYRIASVFSEAERLDDVQRETIERAFQAPVFNYYGSREFGTIGVECERHNGLHVNSEQLYVEVQPDTSVLVTSFKNRCTVFLRYEIGDCAEGVISGQCMCGRSSDRISRVTGRQSDNFIAPDGTVIHGEYVTHLFYHTRAVEQFQMVQNTPTQFTLNVVSRDSVAAQAEVAGVIDDLRRKFGAPLDIEVRFVDEIEKTRTGKLKFTVCNIHREHAHEQ